MMEHFTITCTKCGSTDVELDIGMGQGLGYIVVTCTKCGTTETEEQAH